MTQFSRARGIKLTSQYLKKAMSPLSNKRPIGRRKMTQFEQKKRRVRLILFLAAAIGSASSTLSGTLAVMAMQNPVPTSIVA